MSARDEDEDVLRLRNRSEYDPEQARLPCLPRYAGCHARAEQEGGGICDSPGPRPELRNRPERDVDPQELLLPGPAEGLPDYPDGRTSGVRPPDLQERLARNRQGRRHQEARGHYPNPHGRRRR